MKIWAPYVDYFKFETCNRFFDFSLITDGCTYGVLQFKRVKKRKKTPAQIAAAKRIRHDAIATTVANEEYDTVVFVDEGKKLMVASTSRISGAQTPILTKYKSRSFQAQVPQIDENNT